MSSTAVFRFLDPEGRPHTGSNIRQFALDHDLEPSCMIRVLNGERTHHKGWTYPLETLPEPPQIGEPMALATLIEERLHQLGLNVPQAARIMGVAHTSVYRWVDRQGLPHRKMIPVIADKLGLSEDAVREAHRQSRI